MAILPADCLRLNIIEPINEQCRDEGAAAGDAFSKPEGIAETEARMCAQFAEWLARKEEAERRGVPFTEPMPGADSSPNGHAPQP